MTGAVVVIDMQNGFCHPYGSAAKVAGLSMRNMDEVIIEHARLLAAARAAGVPIVFTRYVWRRNRLDADPAMAAVFGPEAFTEGTWDAAVISELEITERDTVVDKRRFDAFLHTDLDLVLRALGTRRLLLTGVATNGCVETTARTAVQLGYKVSVAEDATSAPNDQHKAGLASIARGFGQVEPWRTALDRCLKG
ncbi:isochorismatase family cysteine hydrolase [Spirillospora sp. NPDC029432]|uniref:cysteine hydrolase family protein n=1 Tax=Spirillospora sp. NPDC029432 TaxID=3154599 RepID=UPI00345230CF